MGLWDRLLKLCESESQSVENAIADGRRWWTRSSGFYDGSCEPFGPGFLCAICHEDLSHQDLSYRGMRFHGQNERHRLYQKAYDLWLLRQQPTIKKQILKGYKIVLEPFGNEIGFRRPDEPVSYSMNERIRRRMNYYHYSSPGEDRRYMEEHGEPRVQQVPVYEWKEIPNPDYKPDKR